MKYGSIKEYFYKLYNYSLLLVLVPPAVFVFLYFIWPTRASFSRFENGDMTLVILVTLFVMIIIELTIVHLYLRRKLRHLSEEAGLGNKMDGYAPLALTKQTATSFSAVIVSICFYLTANDWAAVFFGLLLLWMWLQWPSPRKFCNDLVVRNDERELILNSKDSF